MPDSLIDLPTPSILRCLAATWAERFAGVEVAVAVALVFETVAVVGSASYSAVESRSSCP